MGRLVVALGKFRDGIVVDLYNHSASMTTTIIISIILGGGRRTAEGSHIGILKDRVGAAAGVGAVLR